MADRLEQANQLCRTRRYALEITGTFLPAAFLELFGDPTTNPLGLPVAELSDYLSFVTSGSRGWAEYYVPGSAADYVGFIKRKLIASLRILMEG